MMAALDDPLAADGRREDVHRLAADLVARATDAELAGAHEEAVALFGEAAAIGDTADLNLWYGVRLSSLDRLVEAMAALRRARVLAPDRTDIMRHLALALSDRHPEAIVLWEELVAHREDDVDAHVRLIGLLERSGSGPRLRRALTRAEALLGRDAVFAVFAGTTWASLKAFDRAVLSFVRAFDLDPNQPAEVVEGAAAALLAGDVEHPGLEAALQSAISLPGGTRRASIPVAALLVRADAEKAWRYFLSPSSCPAPTAEIVESLRNTPFDALRHAFATTLHRVREVRTDDADRISQMIGRPLVDPYALRRDGFDFDVWFEKHDTLAVFRAAGSVTFQRRALSDAAFDLQRTMLRTGRLSLVSPLDGRRHDSECGFVLEYHRDRGSPHAGSGAAYFFSTGEPAFAMFSGEENWPMAWFYPRLNLLVRERGFIEVDGYLLPNIAELKALIVGSLTDSLAYCHGSTSGRQPLAIFGSNDFISTHLFEDVAGFDRLIETGEAAVVRQVLISAKEEFGTFETLFPELGTDCVVRRPSLPDSASYNRLVWGWNALPVRIAGGFATAGAAERVIAAAQEQSSSEWLERVRTVRAAHFPILVINLRRKRRVWTASPAEIAAMLDSFRARYPSSAFIFDGTVKLRFCSETEEIVAAEREQVFDLVARMTNPAPHLLAIGETLSDAIVATEAGDMHLSIQGTSTTRAVLISNKPGVIIGPRQFWWDTRNYRQGCAPQINLRHIAIDAAGDNMSAVDFDCPTSVVLDALHEIAASITAPATSRRR